LQETEANHTWSKLSLLEMAATAGQGVRAVTFESYYMRGPSSPARRLHVGCGWRLGSMNIIRGSRAKGLFTWRNMDSTMRQMEEGRYVIAFFIHKQDWRALIISA
jgi:hypothetical protein